MTHNIKFKVSHIQTIIVILINIACFAILISSYIFSWEPIFYWLLAIGSFQLLVNGLLLFSFWRQYRLIYHSFNDLLSNNTNLEALVPKGNYSRPIIDLYNNWLEKTSEIKEILKNLHLQSKPSFQFLEEGDQFRTVLLNTHSALNAFWEKERRQAWIAEGMDKYVELAKNQHLDISEFCQQSVSMMARRLNANQGSLYLLNNIGSETQENVLEFTASYAFDISNENKKQIRLGEGTLGQAVLEKNTLLLNNIPSQYVKINSGLGEATPNNLVIVPMIYKDQCYGAFEIASFQKIASHEIQYLEKVGEQMGSTLASKQNSFKTRKLLEETQQMASQLREQESDMRNNLEELTIAQEEMQRKQDELNAVILAIDNTLIMAAFSPEGQLIKANSQLLNLTKYNFEELKPVMEQLWDQHKEDIQFSIKNKEVLQHDSRIDDQQGHELWLQTSFNPSVNASGELTAVIMLALDITEKKLVLEKLSLVTNHTDNSVILLNEIGHIDYVNEGFTKMTGYTLDEVIGQKPQSFLQGPDTNQEMMLQMSEKIRNGETFVGEILNYKKNGDSYWNSLMINPVKNDRGIIDRYIAVQTDITETKLASLDSAGKLKAISTANMMLETDISGNILSVNTNFCQAFEYSESQIIQQSVFDFINLKKDNIAFWEKLQQGQFVSGEFAGLNQTGSRLWIRGVFTPIMDLSNEPIKIVLFAVDITQEKKLEEEQVRQEAELHHHLDAIQKTIASMELSMEGEIIHANPIFTNIAGYSSEEIKKQSIELLLSDNERNKPQHQLMWENLREGKFFAGEFKLMDASGKEMWLNGTYNPIPDHKGQLQKVMMFAQFTTQEKEKQAELSGMVTSLKNSIPVIELHPDGRLKSGNELFLKLFNLKRLALKQKNWNDLLATPCSLENLQHGFHEDSYSESVYHFETAHGQKLLKATFTPVRNLENKINKVVVLLLDQFEGHGKEC